MSYGIVVCSKCYREVHQDPGGPRDIEFGITVLMDQ